MSDSDAIMGSGRTDYCVWWGSTSSSSVRLVVFLVPLLLVAGLISVLGPNASNWVAQYNILLLTSASSEKPRDGLLNSSFTVVAATDAHSKVEFSLFDYVLLMIFLFFIIFF